MLSLDIDTANGIALLSPDGPLSAGDFRRAAEVIDPYIERSGHLNGLVIHVESFPGWDSFAALLSHFHFVHDHHRKITRVALATDSFAGRVAESLGSHFVNAEIRSFPYQELDTARYWAAAGTARD